MSRASRKIALLVNMGTPDAYTVHAVRRYLYEFLSDPRVIALPAWLWKPCLSVLLLAYSKCSAQRYRSIWGSEGSPLLIFSKKLAEKVQARLGEDIELVLAMRYGHPSLQLVLESLLRSRAVDSLTILPLYPQYASTTTGSCFDVLGKMLSQQRVIPSLHFISSYFNDARYIAALEETVRQYWSVHGTGAYLLFSFHGLPKRCTRLGDPYEYQCRITVELLARALDLSSDQYQLVFQSRFGRAEWLQPYCDVVLRQLPLKKMKEVAVLCPGFSVDCLESLEEIAQRYRNIFLSAGGEKFDYIPALNDSVAHADFLAGLIREFTGKT